MKRLYEVTYDGLWLGGTAIVFATSPEDAIAQVAADSTTVGFKDVTVKLLPKNGVVYNDNGNY